MSSPADESEPGSSPLSPQSVGSTTSTESAGALPVFMNLGPKTSLWDPVSSSDWDAEKPSQNAILRIQRDIANLFSDPPPGILVVPMEDDCTKLDALVMGPADTPYENGFFHFYIRMPPNYPIIPPRVRLMTTDSGRVRFNPNLYACGKVCLSILGTWGGPSWRATQTLSSVLISIQSLLTTDPYYNEPGFNKERHPGDSKNYNKVIEHETMRVAVCSLLEGRHSLPKMLQEFLTSQFPELCESYIEIANERQFMDGQRFRDPFSANTGKFGYKQLIDRLQALKAAIPPVVSDAEDEKVYVSDLDDDDPDGPVPDI